MRKKEEYDQHLLQFYAETFRAFALKNGLSDGRYQTNEAEGFANTALKQYGSAINNGIALELISNIKLQNTTVNDCIDNYPTMFWQTGDGLTELKDLTRRDVRVKVDKLIDKIMRGNLLETSEIEEALKSTIQSSKKVAFKDMNTSYKMLQDFTTNLQQAITHFKEEPDNPKFTQARNEKLDAEIAKINNVALNVYGEELTKKEKVDAFSAIQQYMQSCVHELLKNSSVSNTNSPKI